MQNTEHGVSKGRRKYQRTLKKKKRFLTGLSNVSLSSDERYGWSVVLVKKKKDRFQTLLCRDGRENGVSKSFNHY